MTKFSSGMNSRPKFVLRYDQASGYEGVDIMAQMFEKGWETLLPLEHVNGFYQTVLVWPWCTCE